jgi:hypothetical protein
MFSQIRKGTDWKNQKNISGWELKTYYSRPQYGSSGFAVGK